MSEFCLSLKYDEMMQTWIMCENRSTSNWPSLNMGAFDNSYPNHPFSFSPFLVQDVAGDKSEQEIEDSHDSTELCSVAAVPTWVVDS